MFGDCMAVGGFWKQRAQDEDIEGALEEFYTGGRVAAHYVGILLHVV
jgi:hypothetical protein